MGLNVGDIVRFKKIYNITVDDLINKKNYSQIDRDWETIN